LCVCVSVCACLCARVHACVCVQNIKTPVAPPAQAQFIVDVDINHSSQKHILTRGTFADQVSRSTGGSCFNIYILYYIHYYIHYHIHALMWIKSLGVLEAHTLIHTYTIIYTIIYIHTCRSSCSEYWRILF